MYGLNAIHARSSIQDTPCLTTAETLEHVRDQALSTNVIFMRTRYSVIFPFSATTS